MKAIIVIFSIILISGCVDEDIDNTFNKTHIKPEYSIPIGTSTYSIKKEFNTSGSSTVPGIYGLVYFNDNPYTLDYPYFIDIDTSNFSFNLNPKWLDNAERISFRLYTESTLPSTVITQVYFLDQSRSIVDSLSATGPIQINGGKVGTDGKVNSVGVSIFDFPLDRGQINRFSDIAYFYTLSYIQVYKPGQPPVQFYDSNKIDLKVGVRVKLNIGLDQL